MAPSFATGCTLCPRHCKTDRTTRLGFCHATLLPEVASIAIHKGEEPPLCGSRGVVNLLFSHCNLQCLFCQNHDISRAEVAADKVFYHSMEEIVERIAELLPHTEHMLGFVSPSHYAHLIAPIVEALHARGLYPTTIYNSNGYDDVATLRSVAPYIDIFLPDMKYMHSALAARYSHAADYPQKAQEALLEMYSQKGSGLPTDDHGLAFRGMIVRHLVLPGQVQNSIDCLRWIAHNLSPRVHISLMAQYFPPEGVGSLPDELHRTLLPEEYERVVEAFHEFGFTRGWLQELSSQATCRPDFSQKQSFE